MNFIILILLMFYQTTQIRAQSCILSKNPKDEFLNLVLPQPRCCYRHKQPHFHRDRLGNYEPFPPPQQGGEATLVPGVETQMDMYEYGMSMQISDSLPLDRNIKDFRHPGCKHWSYPDLLPSTSVVIVFFNEGLSVLLRTVVSILNRSPQEFLKEVLLVDDFSNLEYFPNLGSQLELWVAGQEKVRLIRNQKREGLIRSKNIGTIQAIGEVVVFLDAHCEVGLNWLPPLLAPILEDPRTLTVPLVNTIDHTTFEFKNIYSTNMKTYGIWEWGLLYKERHEIADGSDINLTSPYPSPLHAGGLIAFNREYFLSLGGYDNMLRVWGGEQYELSFKAWMCGGRILWVPCSYVGHVYRKFSTFNFGDIINSNLRRVVETWFDEEHKQYFYTRNPMTKYINYGDIQEQLKFRKKCKPFSWFMQQVAPMVYLNYPKIPENVYWGQISLESDPSIFWRFQCKEPPCEIEAGKTFNTHLVFRINKVGQLGLGERCVAADQTRVGLSVHVCPASVSSQELWRYSAESRSMMYRRPVHENVYDCVQYEGENLLLLLRPCTGSVNQKWVWKQFV